MIGFSKWIGSGHKMYVKTDNSSNSPLRIRTVIGFSKWIGSGYKMYVKTDNSSNSPLRIRTLFFKKSRKIFSCQCI